MKKTIISIILIITTLLCGCDDAVSTILQSTDKYVLTIQNAQMTGSSHTYKEVFDNFFSNPSWKHFTSDTGEEVVEFTGNCLYAEQEVEAKIQFVITNETDDYMEWEASYLSFNDVSQPLIMLGALLEKAIDDYPGN